jgi:hypothetical protein
MNLPFQIEITQELFIAFVLIVLAAWIRRTSLSGKGNWDKAWNPAAASLTPGAVPMVSARQAVTGCATWVIGWLFLIVTIALVFDFLLFQGEAALFVWTQLPEWLAGLRDALMGLLRSLARLVL